MHFPLSRIRGHLPAAASGAALIFCFPAFDIYPLAWVCIAPLLVRASRLGVRGAFLSGLIFGIPYFFGTEYWIYHSINHYGGVPLALSLAIVLALSVYQSLYTALFSAFFSHSVRATRLPALFLAPVIWVSLEYARSYALTGFPWSSLGYSQYKFLHMIQIADMTGIYGVSFLVMAANGAIADIFILRKKLREMPLFSPSYTVAGFALLGLVLLISLGYGSYRLGSRPAGDVLRASIIQGNIEQDMKWDPAYQKEVMDTYERMTTGAGFHNPSLIVWPETAVPFFFGADSAMTEGLADYQRGRDSHLLFGAITVKETGELANSAVLLDGDGNTVYTYDKIHLVPFGEYVPLRKLLFFVEKLAYGIGDYAPGRQYVRGAVPSGEFATLVCYEIIFPGLVRKFFRDGGDFIVTITNDAWFGRTNGPYQHWSMAVLRAVENRKPVIRAANTGVSGFIDSRGRIVKSTVIFERRTITADIRTDPERTFYSKFGDILSFLSIVAAALIFLNTRR